MTKEQMLEFLEQYEDGDVIDEYELVRYQQSIAEARERFIEELEERQYASGFYAQQDVIEMYRRERQGNYNTDSAHINFIKIN